MTNTEKIFAYLDDYATKSEDLYLEAVIQACQNWLNGEEVPSLTDPILKEDIRRGIQLAVLKGMKQQAQPNHQMTPDAIGLLLGHFANKLMKNEKNITILDPAVGTGNLLYTVMNGMEQQTFGYTVEIDELLVRLAAVTAELLEQQVSFIVQDALRPLLIDPVDLVVADLPVGYYPDDENGLNYALMPAEGHAYAHHLFIEQSLKHMKKGGYGIFVIPATLFDSEQASQLHGFLKKEALIRAVIQLPSSLFKSTVHEKSLLILQKPMDLSMKAPEVLLAKVPSMSNKEAMTKFLQDIDAWVEQNNIQ